MEETVIDSLIWGTILASATSNLRGWTVSGPISISWMWSCVHHSTV